MANTDIVYNTVIINLDRIASNSKNQASSGQTWLDGILPDYTSLHEEFEKARVFDEDKYNDKKKEFDKAVADECLEPDEITTLEDEFRTLKMDADYLDELYPNFPELESGPALMTPDFLKQNTESILGFFNAIADTYVPEAKEKIKEAWDDAKGNITEFFNKARPELNFIRNSYVDIIKSFESHKKFVDECKSCLIKRTAEWNEINARLDALPSSYPCYPLNLSNNTSLTDLLSHLSM